MSVTIVQSSAYSRWIGSTRDAHARLPRRLGDAPDAVDDGLVRPARPGEEEHADGLERCEAPDGRADRLDPLVRVQRALHQRQRQDRRNGGDAVGRPRAPRRGRARGRARRRRRASSPRSRSPRRRPTAYAATSSANDARTVVICGDRQPWRHRASPSDERQPLRARVERAAAAAARARRSSPSRLRDPGPDACSRRCARASAPPSGARGATAAAARRGSGRARARRSRCRRRRSSGSRPRGRRASTRAGRAWRRRGSGRAARAGRECGRHSASRSSSVHVPSPTSSSPAASPFGRDGSSWSWSHRIHEPSGARDGSTAMRLADGDRGLGREQAAIGLVHRARDAVEPGREVDDRRPDQSLVALPVRAAPTARSGSCIPARPKRYRRPASACAAGTRPSGISRP